MKNYFQIAFCCLLFGSPAFSQVLAPPTASAATNIACTSFTANWSAVTTATNYFLDVSTVNTFATFVTGFNGLVVNTTSSSVTGLSAGTNYFYRVRAFNAADTSNNSSTITVATTAVPAAPTANAATGVGCTSFTANWAASAGATDYFLDVSTVNTFASFVSGFNNLDVNNVTTFNVTGLTAGTTYFYRVRALGTCGTSSSSSTITIATTAIPATPAANAATGVGCTSFTANWAASAGATDYFLDVSTVNTFASFVSGFNNLDVNNVTSFNVTGLAAGTTYFYRVRASNSCGTSSNSLIITIATTAIPATPTANAGTGAGCTSFTANWAASAGATDYFLDVSTVNTFASFVSGFNNLDVNNVTTFNVTGLTAGTTYFYRVRASNACGTSSSSSTITFATSPATPASTTANAGTNVGCISFTANWSASTATSDYFLDVSTVNTFASFVSGFNNLDVNNVTTFNVTGLTAGTTYFYRVRASNSCGTSSNSNVISLTTTAIPATPTANAGTNAGCTSFTANWAASTGASDYVLDVSTVNSFATFVSGFNNLDVNNVTTFNVTGLSAGTTYFYRVRASNACGTSSSSSTITVSTAPTNTISLTSVLATSNQTVCITSPITNITYATSGATSANFIGLPNGVNGNWNNNVVTISGTPTQSGLPFTYTVTMVGGCAGTPNSASGTITVRPIPTLSGVTASTTCFNTQPVITLNGLVSSNDNFQVAYSIGGASQPSAAINYTGTTTSITAPGNLTANSNVSVQSISYSNSPSCTFSASLAASPITVRPQITLTSTTATSVCAGQQSTITLNGLPANTSFSVNYQIQGSAQTANNVSSNNAGTATFLSSAIAGTPLTQSVIINSISFTTPPACTQSSFSAGSNTAQLSVNPAPVISSIIANPVCAGTPAISIGINGSNLSDNVTYTIVWNQQPGGASTSGNIDANGSGSATIGFNISSGAGIGVYTGTITIVNSSSGCPGNSATDTLVIIKAIPQLQILSNLSVCDNDNVSETIININPSISGSVSGSWNFSNSAIMSPSAADGTFSSLPFTIPSFAGQNNGTTSSNGSFSATVTVNGCTSSSTTIRTVIVKPRPTITVTPANGFSFCDANSDLNGNPQPITVNPNIAGTTVTWTNSNAAIGLPVGPVTGNTINISTWNETVTTSLPISGILEFTSSLEGCQGNTVSNYTIALNPTPIPTQVGNISLCHDASLNIPLSASPAATLFDWTIEWPSNVPPQYPTSGNISTISAPSMPNNDCENIEGTIKARATSANGCRTSNFATLGTVTVRPQPNLNAFVPINICNGNTVNSIAVNSCVTGQQYTWNYSSNQPAIGLIDTTGTTPPVFNAAITGEQPVTGTIVFTPTLSGCPTGPAQSLQINVNPGPLYNATATVDGVANTELLSSNAVPYEICSGDQLSSIVFNAATTLLADTVKWKFSAASDIQFVGPETEGIGLSTPALTVINNSNTDFKVFTLEVKAISTASSCDITRIYNFQVNPKPVISLNGASIGINDSLILCHASPSTLTLGSTTSGGNTFAWQHTNTNIGLGGTSGESNPIVFTPDNTNVVLGNHSTFTVSTESDKGCTSDSKSFTVSVFQKPAQPLLSLDNPNQICSGSDFVSIAVTNPDEALSYTWNFSANLSPSFGEVTGPNNAFDVNAAGSHSVTVEAISNRGCGSDVSTQLLTASQNSVAFDLGIAITANNDGFIALAAESVDQYFWGRDRCSDLSTEDLPGCNDLQLCFPATGVDLNNFGYWVEAVAGACRTKAYYWGENACITTLSAESTVALETLVVYPNPSADGLFTLKGINTKSLRIIITDNSGRRVEPEIAYEINALKIDLSNLAAGIYVIQATGEHSMPISFRIVNLAN